MKIQPYFNQNPNSVCYHELLGFYLCQSKMIKELIMN